MDKNLGNEFQLVNTDEFEREVFQSPRPVLVFFDASWSQPCRELGIVLKDVSRVCADRWKLVSVNVDESPVLSFFFAVMVVPSLLFFSDGDLRETLVGTASKETIVSKMESALLQSLEHP